MTTKGSDRKELDKGVTIERRERERERERENEVFR
jgi:hypothetical protein